MSTRSKGVFINICVADVEKSVAFFRELGFEFDEKYTNGVAGCLILQENVYVMLLCEEHFQIFTPKTIVHTKNATELLLGIQLETPEAVNALCERAFSLGARRYKEPEEVSGMYGWGFEDLDGHIWECFNTSAEPENIEAAEEKSESGSRALIPGLALDFIEHLTQDIQ